MRLLLAIHGSAHVTLEDILAPVLLIDDVLSDDRVNVRS